MLPLIEESKYIDDIGTHRLFKYAGLLPNELEREYILLFKNKNNLKVSNSHNNKIPG